ncbi:MAG: glycine cleavage system protein H [Candidatus Thermofonsia Clade 1 bacterium]|jgi:glycine cleavage system H protein|uniref:Glycine cleavage system H protein n=1 Tax=Candidatus Thermofonsia Clade 1 bacterium TaxID=2364210 RepID=A0A2M8PF02_9CHLR|nr:MAG: glycine cleavage system protein H [Candidatus Thermofonsia Clade 1 bacterium]RMF49087.1 MAG: glycine cleavage system protein GcvH [Chloroflexota bacterium]
MAQWKTPDDCRYTKSDEWVRLEGAEALVGITDYAQSSLSDIVFIELPSVGARLKAGERFGTVESVKAAADLNMPISGEIIAVNSALSDAPEKINNDPFGEAWLIRIKPSDLAELDALMDAEAYLKYCEERG